MPQDVRVPIITPLVTTMNAQFDPALLSETEVQTLENFMVESGLLRARKGNTTSASTAQLGGNASAAGQALKSIVLNGNVYLFAVVGGKIFYSLNPNEASPTWTQIPGPPTSPALSTTLPVAIEGTGNLVLFQDGTNPPIYWDGTNIGTIEPVLPPRLGKEFSVYRSWSAEWVPCVSTGGRDTDPTSPNYLNPHYYINEWQWAEGTGWTTLSAGGGVTITITDPQTVTIQQTGQGATHAANFKAGTVIGLKDASRYIRACVLTATATNANLCTLTFPANYFTTVIPSFPHNVTSYIRRKGLGGTLANSGRFYMAPRPWDWLLVGSRGQLITNEGTSATQFRTYQNIASELKPGLYIRVTATREGGGTKQFTGHVVSAVWTGGSYTLVTLLESVVPTFGLGTWQGTIERRADGSIGTYPSLQMVLTPAATPGQTIEVYVGLDGLANGSHDHTLDLTDTYQLAWHVLQEGFGQIDNYVKLSIGESSGNEIEFTNFDEASRWLYVGLLTRQSDYTPIPPTARDSIAYIRFTVVQPPTTEVGTIRMPLYGFRGTGSVPGDAQYAFRLTRYNPSETLLLARSRYVELSEIAVSTNYGHEFLKPPDGDPNFYYQFQLVVNRRLVGDGMQIFRRDTPLGEYRMTSLKRNQTVYENGLLPSVLTGLPTVYWDFLPPETLLSRQTIGSATEMALPKAAVMFQHQGRLVCGDVQEPVEGNMGFSETAQRLRVYLSAEGHPLRFDSQTSVGDDADVKDPIYFTLASSLPGDWLVAGVSVAGGGSGRAVLATTTRTFVLTGSHAADFTLESVGEMGCFGRRALAAHKGVAYFVGSDRQLWAVGLALQRIAAPKIETLLSNPYLVDAHSRGIALKVGDNKLWISVLTTASTAYCLYGDLRPTYEGGEIAWAMEPSGPTWYECFEQAYPRYDNLSQVWAIEKTFGGGGAVKVVRLHTDASASNTLAVRVKSREFWSFDQTFMARKLLLMCSKQVVQRNLTVTVYTEKETSGQSFTLTVPTSGALSADRVDLVRMLPTKALVGKVFSVQVSGVVEPLWKLYDVELHLTPTATPERTATNV